MNDSASAATNARPDLPGFLQDQPHAIVERDGVRYTLLGTAHVSQASVDAVKAGLADGRFDSIAVELDENRHRAMAEPDALAKLDLFQIIREGKTGLVAANLALAAYQRRLAEQLGVEPGAELKAAAVGARERDLHLALIDRDVGITLRRAWHSLGFWSRIQMMTGLVTSLFVDEKVEEGEIEKLKQGDLLESSFGEFAAGNPPLYRALIAERDRYMGLRLRQSAEDANSREVLAVVGAGHLKGLEEQLRSDAGRPDAELQALEEIPEGSRVPWFTLALAALLLGGFAWGWHTGGAELGAKLVLDWILITGIGGAVGCLLAGGHPLSIAAAFLASPITPLHPALSSGMLSALVETWRHKPTYADFLSIRDDSIHLRGWWRNRVTRILLNFTLTNLGTAVAVWVAGLSWLGKLG